jgi:hypothetical protein
VTPSSGATRSLAAHLGVVALVKVAASAAVVLAGFSAVSDDDFARVVIAEEWAHAPKLDASGTSWLPLPFWITGAAMLALGRGIGVARGAAVALGIASAALVYVAARWITEDRRAALYGAIVAAAFPWSACLGVATVPELPAAALALFAVASLVPVADADRGGAGAQPDASGSSGASARSTSILSGRALLGGAALAASSLSRYEAWPVAAVFAAIVVHHAARGTSDMRERARLITAAALALAGPTAWVIWNRVAHGDALHFLERVAAYRRALGGGAGGGSALSTVFAYPIALARHEPELLGSFVLLAAFTALRGASRAASRAASLAHSLRRYARPAAIVLAQIALLSAAMVKDGAPTHHPERALLSVMLLLAIAAGDLAASLFARAPEAPATSTLPAEPRPGRAALAACLAAWIIPTALFLRPWLRREHFAARGDEVAIGRAAAAIVKPGERVLVEAADYGYFAIMAAIARPEDVEIDRSVDPRGGPSPSSFTDRAALSRRLEESGARYFIARVSSPAVPALPAEVRGAWALFPASSLRSSDAPSP